VTEQRRSWVEQIMGLPISLLARGPAALNVDPEPAFALLRHVDDIFSLYREDSLLARSQRGEIAEPPVIGEVRARCARWKQATGGLFDPVRPDGTWDPSGLVKGWAAERAFALLPGDLDWCLNAGGDVVVRGSFNVGIQDPRDPQGLSAVLGLNGGAVATSGTAARGAHLYDPRTRAATTSRWLSVSVTGPSLESADVLATAAFVAGDGWSDLLARFPPYVGMAVDTGGGPHRMAGWPA
jgi:thiamine biosynthesis lipoprotein